MTNTGISLSDPEEDRANPLPLLRCIALRGEADCRSLSRELCMEESLVRKIVLRFVREDLLVPVQKSSGTAYAVNSSEFLLRLDKMTHRVRTLIEECDSVLSRRSP